MDPGAGPSPRNARTHRATPSAGARCYGVARSPGRCGGARGGREDSAVRGAGAFSGARRAPMRTTIGTTSRRSVVQTDEAAEPGPCLACTGNAQKPSKSTQENDTLQLVSPMLALDVTARPSNLPDFERPPVVEVALSVQFEPLALETKHLALLWDNCRADFPEWHDQPPIAPAFEMFGPGFVNARFRSVHLPRALFRNATATELKQFQADRFVRNWTKADAAPEYPRYERIRGAFADDLHALVSFLGHHSLGTFVPNQCEVTYVNLIPLGDGTARNVGDVISPWSGSYSDSFFQEPEATEVAAHFVITSPQQSEPIGRLHVQGALVAYRDTERKALQLTLTARGQPQGTDVDGVLAFLNLGREYIVKGFASFTMPQMHQSWGRRDGSK